MSRIFLDSGDPQETKTALQILGKLDGQTTNPSLIAKNPQAVGKKFTPEEVTSFYKTVVQEVSQLIPQGSVSIEVYADKTTTKEQMVSEGLKMNGWIPNCHIKLPIFPAGLEAAAELVKQGVNINMTLCFSQEQAAAVYGATAGAKPGQVFISPFIGRLDDKGIKGMDLIKNILNMYKTGDGHVEVLGASIRSLSHLTESLEMNCDIVTAPLAVLTAWQNKEAATDPAPLLAIEYETLDLNKPWHEFNIEHELTNAGMDKFAADWKGMIKE